MKKEKKKKKTKKFADSCWETARDFRQGCRAGLPSLPTGAAVQGLVKGLPAPDATRCHVGPLEYGRHILEVRGNSRAPGTALDKESGFSGSVLSGDFSGSRGHILLLQGSLGVPLVFLKGCPFNGRPGLLGPM